MISCIPNCITVLRIIGTFALLFLSPAELSFLIIYLVCGLTDILDGWLARKLKVTSAMGSRLDTAADLFYYIVIAIKIFPALLAALPPAVWIPVWGTALLRICSPSPSFRSRFTRTRASLPDTISTRPMATPPWLTRSG